MGSTGREGFLSSLAGRDSQDGGDDVEVGRHCEEKRTRDDTYCAQQAQKFNQTGVSTCQSQNRSNITVVMVDDVTSTKWQLEQQNSLGEDNHKSQRPRSKGQQRTELSAHNGCVMQRFADGNVSVEGHGGEDEKFGDAEEEVKEGLYQAAMKADGCPGCQKGL